MMFRAVIAYAKWIIARARLAMRIATKQGYQSSTRVSKATLNVAGIGIPSVGQKAGSVATRATLALQQPLEDDSRQHSWTAGRPTPKHRPAANPPPVATALHDAPQTRPGLQTLEEETDHAQIQSPSILSPRQMGLVHSALQHQGSQQTADASTLWQNGTLSHQGSMQSKPPTFTSYPPLDWPPTSSQTDAPHQASASTADGWNLPSYAATAATATTAGDQLPAVTHHMQQTQQYSGDSSRASSSGRNDTSQQASQTRDSLPRAVSPFESIAELPFKPQAAPQAINTNPPPDRVRFAENPMLTPLDTPEGPAYRYNTLQMTSWQMPVVHSTSKLGSASGCLPAWSYRAPPLFIVDD